jgi:oligopeptidase B
MTITDSTDVPAAASTAIKPQAAAAPRPVTASRHGVTLIDEFAWLRAVNWQQVMRDPGALDPAIRKYLDSENAYETPCSPPRSRCRRR